MSHIALFLPDLRGGGAERVFLTLAKELAERGHHVDLVLARAEGEFVELIPQGARLINLESGLRSLGMGGLAVAAVCKLASYLRRERPATLLSTLTGANLVALIASRLAGTSARLVLREACAMRNVRNPMRLALMSLLYPAADGIVALTEPMRLELIDTLRLENQRIEVIPNPVDADALRANAKAPLDHPWFTPQSPPVVMAVSRLAPQKNLELLVHAFAFVRRRLNARLLILGEGPSRPGLEKLVLEQDLADYVKLPGFDVNPHRWLARARLFVLCSSWEGYPNVVLEAQTLGIPVVATAYDRSIVDILGGNLVPPDDKLALASAIIAALTAEHERPEEADPAARTASIIDQYENFLTVTHV